MSGQSRGGGSKEQEEIARLKKEKEEMAEKLRILELEKEGIKMVTLSQFDGKRIAKSMRSRDSLPVFQPIAEEDMIEENPRMAMYEAQAIAIEKEMEMDKMKEEMERLKKEKKEMYGQLKRLGNNQRVAVYHAFRDLQFLSMSHLAEFEDSFRGIQTPGLRLGHAKLSPRMETNYRVDKDYGYWHGGMVYFDEEIYLFGGSPNPKALLKLDKTFKWTKLADMNKERNNIKNSCLEWNGYIRVFGGWNDKYVDLSSVEQYDPKENKWTVMPDMKYARSSAAATMWNQYMVISGGVEGSHKKTKSIECFNPKNGSWVELPNMPTALSHHSLVSYKNKLIVMGGYDGKTLNSVWQLDLQETNPKWRTLPSMKQPSQSFAGIVFDGEIYAIGGVGEGYKHLDRVEIFNGSYWRDGPSLPYPIYSPFAMIVPQHFADRLCNYKPQ